MGFKFQNEVDFEFIFTIQLWRHSPILSLWILISTTSQCILFPYFSQKFSMFNRHFENQCNQNQRWSPSINASEFIKNLFHNYIQELYAKLPINKVCSFKVLVNFQNKSLHHWSSNRISLRGISANSKIFVLYK